MFSDRAGWKQGGVWPVTDGGHTLAVDPALPHLKPRSPQRVELRCGDAAQATVVRLMAMMPQNPHTHSS